MTRRGRESGAIPGEYCRARGASGRYAEQMSTRTGWSLTGIVAAIAIPIISVVGAIAAAIVLTLV